MDDLLITGSSPTFINQSVVVQEVFTKGSSRLTLHYILGLEVIPTAGGLYLTQHKYIREILESTGMAGSLYAQLCPEFDDSPSADLTCSLSYQGLAHR